MVASILPRSVLGSADLAGASMATDDALAAVSSAPREQTHAPMHAHARLSDHMLARVAPRTRHAVARDRCCLFADPA